MAVFGDILGSLLEDPNDYDLQDFWNLRLFNRNLLFNVETLISQFEIPAEPIESRQQTQFIEDSRAEVSHDSPPFLYDGALVRDLLWGEYLDKKENVLLIGNPGTGKTHLVCALAFSACAQGRSVRFCTATDLVTQLGECREEKRLQRLHKQLQRLHLSPKRKLPRRQTLVR